MMEHMDARIQHNAFMTDPGLAQSAARTVPILAPSMLSTASSHTDTMDTTSPSAMMAPPARTSPDNDSNGSNGNNLGPEHPSNGMAEPNAAAAAAAAGGQQPKVVQTAFIHKLYNMLEDQSIQHLISWSPSGESFVMSPSNDFSKVLSQYFKHTNISSFVRQLNMYGFHKVSDVFHTGSPESPLWEFKHGGGNFRRGDMIGLREIKRRASRHALVHRDSYSSGPKPPASQPSTPAEPMPMQSMQSIQSMQSMQESTDSRLTSLEHTMYDVHARLARGEESSQFLHGRHHVMLDVLSRSLQLNQDLSRAMLALLPHNSDNPAYRDVLNIQAEIQRQAEMVRSMDESSEPPFSASRPTFSGLSIDNPPVSPRQVPQDLRTPSLSVPRQNFYRPPVPSHLSTTPRKYGSIGSTSGTSPNSLRPQVPPPPPPPPHPSAAASSPPANILRRHTSADIRNVQGWQANPSPFNSSNSSAQWPSSPRMNPMSEEQHIRDSFSSYSLTTASSHGRRDNSRPTTPPYPNGNTIDHLNSWSWGAPRDKSSAGLLKDSSGPPTRRGSMAHILNPAETAERAEEHEDEGRDEDRKRKRLQ